MIVRLRWRPLLAVGCALVLAAAAARIALGARGDPPVIWSVPTDAPEVALTFDDGPDPTYTPQVLALLRSQRAVATFFVLGLQAERFPALVRQEAAEGSQVCPHGWSHTRLRGRSAEFVRQQVTRTAAYLRQLGVPACPLFRFPYFSSDLTSRRAVADLGYRIVAADVDTRDWSGRAAGTMASQVLAALKPGDIVLFHDAGGHRAQTVRAVRAVLEGMAAKGLRAVTLQTLLASARPRTPPAASGTAA